jgi:hypothetical protein
MAVLFTNDYMLLPTQYVPMTAGENDNVVINSSSVSFIPTANGDSVTGMIPPDEITSGGLCYVSNADETVKSIIIKDNDSSSTDIYRFHLTHGSTTLTLANHEANLFYYVPTGVAATTGWYPYREGTFA